MSILYRYSIHGREAVSFEEALRNLAAKLTGQPASALPKTQEAIVQYMAKNVPSLDEMVEAVTARIAAAQEEPSEGADGSQEGTDTQNDPATGSEDGQDGSDAAQASQDTPASAEGSDAATDGGKTTKNTKTKASKA